MSAPTAAPAKKKSKLKMPHLLFLMLGLILLMSLLTYIGSRWSVCHRSGNRRPHRR